LFHNLVNFDLYQVRSPSELPKNQVSYIDFKLKDPDTPLNQHLNTAPRMFSLRLRAFSIFVRARILERRGPGKNILEARGRKMLLTDDEMLRTDDEMLRTDDEMLRTDDKMLRTDQVPRQTLDKLDTRAPLAGTRLK
jgi:hypothetical protein